MLVIALFADHRAIVEEQGSSHGRGQPADAVSMTAAPSTFKHSTPISSRLPSGNDGNREARVLGWTWGLWDSVLSSASCLRGDFSAAVGLCVSASPSLKWQSLF